MPRAATAREQLASVIVFLLRESADYRLFFCRSRRMKDSGVPTLLARSKVTDKALAFPSRSPYFPSVGEDADESKPQEMERTEVASCL